MKPTRPEYDRVPTGKSEVEGKVELGLREDIEMGEVVVQLLHPGIDTVSKSMYHGRYSGASRELNAV